MSAAVWDALLFRSNPVLGVFLYVYLAAWSFVVTTAFAVVIHNLLQFLNNSRRRKDLAYLKKVVRLEQLYKRGECDAKVYAIASAILNGDYLNDLRSNQ